MNNLYLGIMTGTSLDAIDIAVVNFDSAQPIIHSTYTTPLPAEYKERYLRIINTGECKLEELGDLDNWTGELQATAVIKCLNTNHISSKQVNAIGMHGQTLWHAPLAKRPFTWQLGDANVVAVKTGIKTISDFRRANIAAGGHGAPLAPALHKAIFSNHTESRCVVNIGGFSNISVLENNNYLGFDTGPGNCLMDAWTQQHFNLAFDQDGKLAANGIVNEPLLDCLLDDPYFKLPAPKSTGREYFNMQWLQDKLSLQDLNLTPLNILATLLQLTVHSIALAVKNYARPNTTVYLCGGGAKNLTLLAELSKLLHRQVYTTAELGVDPQWVEAVLIAWLAKETLASNKINLHFTGAKFPVVLGAIYQ